MNNLKKAIEILAQEYPSKRDIQDALEDASSGEVSEEGKAYWTEENVKFEYIGELTPKQIESIVGEDEMPIKVGMRDPDDWELEEKIARLNDILESEGSAWTNRALFWLDEGIPPIILTNSPEYWPPFGGKWRDNIADGHGRIVFAEIFGLAVPTWFMRLK